MPAGRDNKPRWSTLLIQAMIDMASMNSQRVRYRGRSFVVTDADLANGRFIRRIVAARQQALAAGKTPPRLVTFREEFRRIANQQRIGGLIECLQQPDLDVVRLAIWLIARAHTSVAIWAISPFSQSRDVRVRYEAARALRRLGAWAELRSMMQHESNHRVRRLATAPMPKSFDKRFERFAGHAPSAAQPDAPCRTIQLFTRVSTESGRPAKSPEFIRVILERIQRLVRGH